jgi:hypothetical protein
MKILRLEDRFKINLNGVIITVAPLAGRQKLEMTSMIRQHPDGKLYLDKPSQELFLIKHSVKSVEGLKDYDDQDYALEFEGNELSDNCAEELLSFLVNTWFTVANTQAIRGEFGAVINPIDGKALNGIEVERVKGKVDPEKK